MKQHIVITITDPVQHRWGFQATARPASNPRASEAGTFNSTDSFTQIICNDDSNRQPGQSCPSPGFEFIEHTLEGTRLGRPSPVTFEFDWTPPATDVGDILFYVAANAANGDGTQFGDHIYFQTTTLHVASAQGPDITQVGDGAAGSAVIAPNGWISIFGNDLSMTTRAWQPGDFNGASLPTALDQVSVTVNGQPAYVEYISPGQINALAPAAGQGSVSVQVTNNGTTSNAFAVTMQPLAPALFQFAGGNVAAEHGVDYSLIGPPDVISGATPAVPGETILLYGTGFGQTDPPYTPGQLVSTPLALPASQPVTVTIGGMPASVPFAGLSPGSAGIYQFNVVVPALRTGSYTVVLSYQGGQTESTVLTVQQQ